MRRKWLGGGCLVAGLVMLAVVVAGGAEPPGTPPSNSSATANSAADASPALADAPGLALARERAKLMHEMSIATLEVMHEHYFHVNRAVLPARAMEGVFEEMAREAKLRARWIAVNTKAMSVHHEPKSDFEKKAAAELSAGKSTYEQVLDGVYYRAGPVELGGGCVSCHTGFTGSIPKSPRRAGLVIAVPLAQP